MDLLSEEGERCQTEKPNSTANTLPVVQNPFIQYCHKSPGKINGTDGDGLSISSLVSFVWQG